MKHVVTLMLLVLCATFGSMEAQSYFRAAVGANWLDDSYKDIKLDEDTGFMGSAHVGCHYADYCASGELEFAYRYNELDTAKVGGLVAATNGNIQSYVVMGNVLFTPFCYCDWSAFFGGGIGWGHRKIKDNSVGSQVAKIIGDDKSSFAWQVIAGVKYPCSDCFEFFADYRYLSLNSKLNNHTVSIGLSRGF